MSPGEGLYWYRDDPKRSIEKDIEWACNSLEIKHGIIATHIIVNPAEEEVYLKVLKGLDAGLKLEIKKSIQLNHFWLEAREKGSKK
jgi:hypothetical protein